MRRTPRQPAGRLPPAAAVLCLLLSAGAAGFAVDKKSPGPVQKGRALYAQHCVSCHGASGVGGGPTASALKIAPPDLTRISKKYKGYPADKVMDWIDGTKYAVNHGSRKMPVWGKRFNRSESNSSEAPGEVQALSKYLESIQKK